MTELAIVVLNYNTKKITANCLASVFKNPPKTSFKVVLVDNASSDGSASYLKKKFPTIDLIENKENLGFAAGNNVGIRKYKKVAKQILLLNSDTIVKKGALDGLVKFQNDTHFGIVGPKLLNKDGTFQAGGGALPSLFNAFLWLSALDDLFSFLKVRSYQMQNEKLYRDGMQIGWVPGTAMLVKSKVYKRVGLLDEELFMYGEDVEFCLRASKKGVSCGWTDQSSVVHLGGASLDKVHERQWLGEFKGLQYIYDKHYSKVESLILNLLLRIFIYLRVCAFALVGKRSHSKTYAKILKEI